MVKLCMLLIQFFLWVSATPDTVRLTLLKAVRLALDRSPEIRQMDQKVAFSGARYDEARAHRWLPEFSLTTAHAPAPRLTDSSFPRDRLYLDPELRNDWEHLTMFNQVEVSFTQPLYLWGELRYSIDAARAGQAADAAAREQKVLEITHRTAQLYYNMLLTDALYRLTEETGDVIRRAKRELNRLLEQGDPSVDDSDLFQVQIVEQEYFAQVAEVTQQRALAYAAMRRQLVLPDSTVLEPGDRFLEPLFFREDSLNAYLAEGLKNRPELQQAAAGRVAYDALLRVARSDLYPKLYLAGSGRYAYTPGRYRQPNPYIDDPLLGRSFQAGIGFRQKLNFGITRARIRQAEARLKEATAQEKAARLLALYEIEAAYRNVLTARSAMRYTEEALRISKEWLQTEQINFDLELGDSEDLVRAVKANLELRARYYTAVHRYNLSVLDLYRATGTLTKALATGMLLGAEDR